ncbi:MAG: hypothetical protein ACYTAO_02090 [Planctomycetota bacterium]|jgi:hypothetical protein
MILVWQMRQDIEYYSIRALVQAAIDIDDKGKAVQEAWKQYTDAFFPHVKSKRDFGDKAALAMLMKEVKKGGLKVRPLMPLVRSKLHGKRIRHYGPDDDNLSGVREREDIAVPGQQRGPKM